MRFTSVPSILAFVAVLACASVAQAGKAERKVIAVVVDDSGSMSAGTGGRAGNDPKGLAAFAASQMPRFAPEGADLAVFTYASANDPAGGKPLYVIRSIDDDGRKRSMSEIRQALLEKNAEEARAYAGAHPYWWKNTPCLKALQVAGEWTHEALEGADPSNGSVLFLTDGACNGKADPRDGILTANPEQARKNVDEYLGGSGLYCVALGDNFKPAQLNPICREVQQASAGEEALSVLKAFITNLDEADGGQKLSQLFTGGGEESLPSYEQAVAVNLIITEDCQDGCDPLSDLPPELKEKLEGKPSYHKVTWRWPTARRAAGPNFYVHGTCEQSGSECDFQNKPCGEGDRCVRKDEGRFETTFVRLTWKEMEAVKGHLNTSKDGRSAIVRPEYWIRPVMQVYEGELRLMGDAKTRGAARLALVRSQRSTKLNVWVEMALAAVRPEDVTPCYETDEEGNLVDYRCNQTTEVCYANQCKQLATWETMDVVYAGGASRTAVEGSDRFVVPHDLQKMGLKSYFGACLHQTKSKKIPTGEAPQELHEAKPFHVDDSVTGINGAPMWRSDHHLPKGAEDSQGWLMKGWNELYFHLLPKDARAGDLCPAAGARVPSERLIGKLVELRHTDDMDGDGYASEKSGGDDCGDSDVTVRPGHQELCDSKDNDCDGIIDEGLENFATPENIAAGLARPEPNNIPSCDGEREPESLPVSRRGQPNDPDYDNDGCPNTAEEPQFQRDARKQGDEKNRCSTDCAWDLKASKTLTNAPGDGDNEEPYWHLVFGEPMERTEELRTITTDPDNTRLNCITESRTPSFNLRLKPAGADAGFEDDCFTLLGPGVGPAGPDALGWTVLGNTASDIDLRLQRKHICGKLGPPEDKEHSTKIYGRDGVMAHLEVDFSNSAGLKPGNIRKRRRVKLSASFNQSLAIQVTGELRPYADPETPGAGVVAVEIIPQFDEDVLLKMSLDVAPVSHPQHVSLRDLRRELNDILMDAQYCDGEEEGECDPSNLYWVDCDGSDYAIKPDRKEPGVTPETLVLRGGQSQKLCLQYKNPVPCAGGGLLNFCACTENSREEPSASWDSVFCDSTYFKGVEMDRKGGGEPFIDILDGEISLGDAPVEGVEVMDQKKVVSVVVSRNLRDWFFPPGPGWWWLVIVAHIIWLLGTVHTYTHSLWPMKHPDNMRPVVMWFVGMWFVAGFVQLSLG